MKILITLIGGQGQLHFFLSQKFLLERKSEMQNIIKEKIKVHNSTARNNLLHSHYFSMIYSKSLYEYFANIHTIQKDMCISYTYVFIIVLS